MAPDLAATDEDLAVTIDVLANDSDVDGDLDPSSLRISVAAGAGSAAVVAGFGPMAPVVGYVPFVDANGTDTFDYEVCDLAGHCSSGVVTVTVAPVNDDPMADADSASSLPATPVDIDVLANDSDVDGDPLSIDSFNAVSELGGVVACSSTCTYTPPTPWTAADSFSYVVTDGQGGSAQATVTVAPEIPDLRWYLRASGIGDTSSTAKLPLSQTGGPSNEVLPNFDTDRDSSPGLWLQESRSGIPQQLGETDPAKFQLWTYSAPEDLHLLGNGTISIYAVTEGMTAGIDARIRFFLLDCPASTTNGTDCSTISLATVTRRPWSESPDVWVGITADLGAIDHTVTAGRAIVVKVVVAGGESDAAMWLAFDATGYASALTIESAGPAAAFLPFGLQ